MVTRFDYKGKEVILSAVCKGVAYNVWQDGEKRYKFRVMVKYDGKQKTFTFYDSVNNYCRNVYKLDRKAMLYALECFITDGHGYDLAYNFMDFANEFGYDFDDKHALTVYHACERHHNAAQELFGEEYAEILEVLNELQEEE